MLVFAAMMGKTWTVEVEPSTTVGELKVFIQDKSGVPPAQQHWVYAGKSLADDDAPLSQYDVQHDATLHAILR